MIDTPQEQWWTVLGLGLPAATPQFLPKSCHDVLALFPAQTQVVDAGARAPPPLPPTGLPAGWTQEQWNHFGWQYVEALKK